jgi:hypothetical protein
LSLPLLALVVAVALSEPLRLATPSELPPPQAATAGVSTPASSANRRRGLRSWSIRIRFLLVQP